MRRLTFLTSLFATLGLLASAPAVAAGPPVTVFAAASLQDALTAVGKAYTNRTGQPVRFSFGGSSAIAHQIEQGAPADVFISADTEWMAFLEGKNLVVKASRRDLISNQLVLIAPAGSNAQIKLTRGAPLAALLGGGRLAIADPAAVPAGRYGKAALTWLGIWDSVSGKLAPADNVRSALAFVARGEAPLGIVYATDAKVEPKVRVVAVFPEASHPKIIYPAALVASSHTPGAAAFLGFLQGPEAGAIFRRYGFIVLPRPR